MAGNHNGPMQEALDDLQGGSFTITNGGIFGTGLGAVGALPAPVRHLAAGLLASLDQLPPVAQELDVLVSEVHAKRLSIQALQAELGALDRQLEVLERTLVPIQAWGHQMSRIQHALTDTLGLPETKD